MYIMSSLHLTLPGGGAGARNKTHRRATCLPPTCQSFNWPQLPLIAAPPLIAHSRSVRCRVAVDSNSTTTKLGRGSKFVDLELMVRDYELDQYGVVNNAVYSSYCQHVCQELMGRIGVNLSEILSQTGDALAFSELSLKFLAALTSGDKFVARVRMADSSVARVYFDIFIFKLPNLEPVLEAKATGVWLNKSYRPMRIPPIVKSKIVQFTRP